jgi:hypothetical protein
MLQKMEISNGMMMDTDVQANANAQANAQADAQANAQADAQADAQAKAVAVWRWALRGIVIQN